MDDSHPQIHMLISSSNTLTHTQLPGCPVRHPISHRIPLTDIRVLPQLCLERALPPLECSHFSAAVGNPAVVPDEHLGFRKSSFSSFRAPLKQEPTCSDDSGHLRSTISGFASPPDLPHAVGTVTPQPGWGVCWGGNLAGPQRSQGRWGPCRAPVALGDTQCQVPSLLPHDPTQEIPGLPCSNLGGGHLPSPPFLFLCESGIWNVC